MAKKRRNTTLMLLAGHIAMACGKHTASNDDLWKDGKPIQLSSGPWPDSEYRHYLISDFSPGTFFPIFSTLAIGGSTVHSEIIRAVIWVHGLAANANSYFVDGLTIAEAAGQDASTLTIVPWFGETVVNGSFWSSSLDSTLKSIYWYDDVSYAHWVSGGNCAGNVSGGPYTSFSIMDKLVGQLQDATTRFPKLGSITIAGFSAGCQMSSRWAFFSDIVAPSSSNRASVHIIASDCGSYMYLDTDRPMESCRPLEDRGSNHTCSEFGKPRWTRRRYYNSYKYGLHNAVSDNQYSDEELEQMTKDFPSKDVRFLFGSEDSCNCNYPSYNNPSYCFHYDLSCSPVYGQTNTCCDTYPDTTIDNAFDNSSEAMLEGSNRLQRGLNYVAYLRQFYSSDTFPMYGTFEGGHNNTAFGYSESFTRWVFDATRSKGQEPEVLI